MAVGTSWRMSPSAIMTIGVVTYMAMYGLATQRTQSTRVRTRLMVTVVWMIAIALWPLVWRNVVEKSPKHHPCVIIGLIWPICILLFDVLATRKHAYENHLQSKRQFLTMDASTICSLTFAISSYIGAQSHKCCNKIFLWAILGCVAFIMPSPHTHTNTMETIAFEAIQKAVLAYATGMLLTGVMLVASTEETAAHAPSEGSVGLPSDVRAPCDATTRCLADAASRLREAAAALQRPLDLGT
jgi:hypothetical protein